MYCGCPTAVTVAGVTRSKRTVYLEAAALERGDPLRQWGEGIPGKLQEVEAALEAGWCGAKSVEEIFGNKTARVYPLMDDGMITNYPVVVIDCVFGKARVWKLSYWEAGCGGNTFGWLLFPDALVGVYHVPGEDPNVNHYDGTPTPAVIASNFDGDMALEGWGKEHGDPPMPGWVHKSSGTGFGPDLKSRPTALISAFQRARYPGDYD